MAFVREAAFKEQDNPNSLELEEHFKARSVLQPVVVTCINAAKNILRDSSKHTFVAETSRRAKPLFCRNLSLTLPRIHFL
jgi:hypothetical protein